MVYFDTSALVKRYAPSEANANVVRELCESGRHTLFVSSLTGPEVASALRRKEREGHLSAADVRQAWQIFQMHASQDYTLLAVSTLLIHSAEQLILHHPLRAFDAIHLVTAAAVQALSPETTLRFITADKAQARAGEALGLQVEQL
jgi:predicted nucleic acid-binding protein